MMKLSFSGNYVNYYAELVSYKFFSCFFENSSILPKMSIPGQAPDIFRPYWDYTFGVGLAISLAMPIRCILR